MQVHNSQKEKQQSRNAESSKQRAEEQDMFLNTYSNTKRTTQWPMPTSPSSMEEVSMQNENESFLNSRIFRDTPCMITLWKRPHLDTCRAYRLREKQRKGGCLIIIPYTLQFGQHINADNQLLKWGMKQSQWPRREMRKLAKCCSAEGSSHQVWLRMYKWNSSLYNVVQRRIMFNI